MGVIAILSKELERLYIENDDLKERNENQEKSIMKLQEQVNNSDFADYNEKKIMEFEHKKEVDRLNAELDITNRQVKALSKYFLHDVKKIWKNIEGYLKE